MNSESSEKRTILAVDDKLENLKVLIKYLEDSGFELMVAQSGEEAFNHIERVIPDLILLDILMPGIDGYETCRRLKEKDSTKDVPVIFMTALSATMDKVKGFEAGAIDYLTKPLQHEEVLARVNAQMTIRKYQKHLQEQNILLQQKYTALSALIQMEAPATGPIIAESSAMRQTLKQITELSQRSGPTLITGEPGTGRVYMAKKLHERVSTDSVPLIIVDCQRVEDHEASKLLFGATDLQEFISQAGGFGALHLADQGTLVLTNIENLDMESQEILSLYLEKSAEEKNIPHIRLIATTSEDVSSLAEAGRFLPKLAEHLATNTLKMPDMRKRKRDILPLARLFLAERDQRFGDDEHRLKKAAEHALLSGQYRRRNADELREAVEFAALFADGPEITAEHIFTGPKSEGTPFDYNLSKVGLIQWLQRSETPVNILKSVVFVSFFSILVEPNSLYVHQRCTITGLFPGYKHLFILHGTHIPKPFNFSINTSITKITKKNSK